MEVLDNHINKRREMQKFYSDLFVNIEGVEVMQEPNTDYFSNFWLSAIIINSEKTNGITREALRLALEKENIESRPLWKPMHLQPIFQKYPYYGTDVSEKLFKNGLCLPSGSNLTEEEKNRVKTAIKNVFNA